MGHSVLQFPVPPLDFFVRGRYQHYDPVFLSPDPDFVHAHVTALGPWLDQPSSKDLADVAAIVSTTPAIEVTFSEVQAVDGGMIFLWPDPVDAVEGISAQLRAAYPQCEPYGGRYEPKPHLTLDRCSRHVSIETTRAALDSTLPMTVMLNRLDVAWYEPFSTRLLGSVPLRPSN